MKMNFNVTGIKRKELVKIISDLTVAKAEYKYMPTCAYEIGAFTVDKEGTLIFDTNINQETIIAVLNALESAGFTSDSEYTLPGEELTPVKTEDAMDEGAETSEKQNTEETITRASATSQTEATATETDTFSIALPRILFSETSLHNLSSLLEAKGSLIKKALSIDALPIEFTDEQITFPWFKRLPSPEESHAYTAFIAKLSEMARNTKRVIATEKAVDNEKYAFRCFLLRLGFIGEEFKADIKVLLKNLSGSAAFKSGKSKELY